MADQVSAPGPHTRIDPAVEGRLAAAGKYARWIAAIYATVALASIGSDRLDGFLPSGPDFLRELPAAAALPLTLLALGTLLAGDTQRSLGGLAGRRAGSVVAVAIVIYGVYTVSVFTVSFPDLWPVERTAVALPSLWTGLIFIVLGLSVLLSTSRIEVRVVAGQVGAFLVFSATAVIFLGYIFGGVSVGRLFRPPEIAFQSALISWLIAVGVILMRPGSGMLATASSPGAGGRLLRRFGPVVVFLPAILLLVIESLPLTDRLDALAVVSVALGLFLLALLAVVVRVIDETKMEALTSSAEAERARHGLAQEAPLVHSLADSLHIVDIAEDVGIDVATRFRPGQGSVAGDSSVVTSLPDGSVGAVLVDITGHGAKPAIGAIRVRDLLLHSIALGRSPAEAMGLLGWSSPSDVLASAVAVNLDPRSGAVSLASAGHPAAIFVGTQEAELIESTGPLLYLEPETTYGEVRFELSPGDTLVLMSDGIADVQRTRNGRPEPEVLADLLLAEGGVSMRTADLVIGFADAEPVDDQSVLVIRREP